MTQSFPFVEVTRGSFIESVHFGHAVIANASGEIVEGWGDPSKVVLPRSSAKMLQALPLMESGAGQHLTSEQLALACASHSGETRHDNHVRAWLKDLGLDDHALCCGPQPSRDEALCNLMIREGKSVTRAFNNCSGKHSGFLTLAKHLGAGLDYVDPDHPVQLSVRAAFEEMCDEHSPGFGIDGCSAPNFAASLSGIAKAMASFASLGAGGSARDAACVALREAMMEHPELVSGKDRACANLMRAAGGKAAVKTGAEGFFVAILPDQGLGVALKVDDGATRASEAVMAALLVRLGVAEANDPLISRHLVSPLKNWDGLEVGEVRTVSSLMQ